MEGDFLGLGTPEHSRGVVRIEIPRRFFSEQSEGMARTEASGSCHSILNSADADFCLPHHSQDRVLFCTLKTCNTNLRLVTCIELERSVCSMSSVEIEQIRQARRESLEPNPSFSAHLTLLIIVSGPRSMYTSLAFAFTLPSMPRS